MLRPTIALASATLLAACAQAAPDESAEAAAAPDRQAVDLPARPADEAEAEAPAGGEALRDMRPAESGTPEDCESSVGAENPCIQGNYRPLPEEPEGE